MATSRNHLFHRPEECDSFQPCFFEHETDEEFYVTRAPMPNEDIWDKFELLPTPPRSPNREALDDLPCSLLDNEAERLHLQPLISEDLKAELAQDLLPAFPKPLTFPETPPTLTGASGLNSKLIQDCMWSGLSAHHIDGEACAEQKKSEKIGIPGSTNFAPRKHCVSENSVPGDISTECVDPAAVFPYPINMTREYLEIDTPSDSGNEEDEEEEIDVVNVEKIHKTQLPTRRKAALVSRVAEKVVKKSELQAASLLLPAVHACHTYSKQIPAGKGFSSSRSGTSSPVHGHSSYLKRTSVSLSMPNSPQSIRPTASKKMKRHLTTPAELKKVAQKLKACGNGRTYKTEYSSSSSSSSSSCSSRLGSDSEGEGCGKRTQHNVLERKRRNDLKYSFFKLRDTVPELMQQERAPKVVILKKATDHIHELTTKQNRMLTELEKQRQRNEQLKRKLQLLQC